MPTPRASSNSGTTEGNPLPMVALGASAGGLEAFELFFGAMPADSGNALGRAVLEDLATREAEVKNKDGKFYSMKVSPYRTVNNVIDGVVMTFDDVTQKKVIDAALQESEERFRSIFEQSYDSLALVDTTSSGFEEFNRRAHDDLGYSRKAFIQLTLGDILPADSNSSNARALMDREYGRPRQPF